MAIFSALKSMSPSSTTSITKSSISGASGSAGKQGASGSACYTCGHWYNGIWIDVDIDLRLGCLSLLRVDADIRL